MFDSVFSSVLDVTTSSAASVTTGSFLLCSLASIVLGLVIAGIYMFKHDYSKNFVVTIALLPLIVQAVITLVNGNLGAGIAVMGVFNLVRFRSVPGSAKDICAVFLAMAVGLATGMGYLTLAVVFTVIVGIVNVVYVLSPLGTNAPVNLNKTLKITIPEDMDYCTSFDDLFERYTKTYSLENVKSTNMGSLYQLQYAITLASPQVEKALLDGIRTRNGNLSVQCGRLVAERESL